MEFIYFTLFDAFLCSLFWQIGCFRKWARYEYSDAKTNRCVKRELLRIRFEYFLELLSEWAQRAMLWRPWGNWIFPHQKFRLIHLYLSIENLILLTCHKSLDVDTWIEYSTEFTSIQILWITGIQCLNNHHPASQEQYHFDVNICRECPNVLNRFWWPNNSNEWTIAEPT